MKRIVRSILFATPLLGLIIGLWGCDSPFKPQTQFWGVVDFQSRYQKHVWLDGPRGNEFDKVMNPRDRWEGYLTGSQQYTLHWSFTDGTGVGTFVFRPDNIAHNANDPQRNTMDWFIAISDGGVSNFQAAIGRAPQGR